MGRSMTWGNSIGMADTEVSREGVSSMGDQAEGRIPYQSHFRGGVSPNLVRMQ